MATITHSNFPEYLEHLFTKIERIEHVVLNLPTKSTTPLPRYIPMKEAEKVAGKSANALRVQISLGKLKSIKKGSRHYFDREYLENWIAGNVNEEGAPLV